MFNKFLFCSFLFFLASIIINSLIVIAAPAKNTKIIHKNQSASVQVQQKKNYETFRANGKTIKKTTERKKCQVI